MPIYDYRCDHCGHVFSAVQSFSEEALSKCPNCGKMPRRLLSTPAIVFKGSGWYKTDSRPAEKSQDSASANDKTEKKEEKPKSDTKPAESKPAETNAASPKSEAAS